MKNSLIVIAGVMIAVSGLYATKVAAESSYWGTPKAKENFAWGSHRMVLDDYAQTMALQLVEQLQDFSFQGEVAVATLVPLHGNIEQKNWYGEQYAQAMNQHLSRFSVPVTENKLANYLKFTEQGETALTLDFHKISQRAGVNYVVVSQWIARDHGLQITSRLVRSSDKRVLASATQLLPAVVLERSYPTTAAP